MAGVYGQIVILSRTDRTFCPCVFFYVCPYQFICFINLVRYKSLSCATFALGNDFYMRIIENSILPPRGYKAITLGWFIFVRKGTNLTTKDITHESIHWEQEKELFVIGFYLLYMLDFLWCLYHLRKWHAAYRSIAFEVEAYVHQCDEDYIKKRKHFSWYRYL